MTDQNQSDAGVLERLESLERELRRLHDIEDIKRLAASYHRLCDGGWDGPSHPDAAALAELFTDDGVYELPLMPAVEGHDEILGRFEALSASLPWITHWLSNPEVDVEVDADTATGRFKGAACFRMQGQRQVSFGSYFGEFVRTERGWRFASWRFVVATPPDDRAW